MQSFLHKSKLCQNHLMHRTQCHSMIVANIIVKLPKAIKSRKMQLSNIELYLTFHAHVSALDQLYSRHWHCTNDYCELNVLQQDNVATVYQPLCLIHMITVHKSCLISLTWWYGHWSTQENVYSKWLSANHRCESQVGIVSSVYKEWTLKDPWWCDAWSNVNGARHHPAQFWDEADARRKPKMPEVESIPSPCPIPSSPPTSRALRILPRLLLLGAFRANARNDGRSPWTLQMGRRPPAFRIGSLLGSCVSKSSKLGWKKAQTRKICWRPPQACGQWGWNPK